MDLNKLNSWLTLFANLGVLIGIVFLVVELQQNTAVAKSATTQALTDSSADALYSISADPLMADIQLRGTDKYESLNELEKYQFNVYMRARWLRMQNAYIQNTLGILQENVWPTYNRIICSDMEQLGFQATWPIHKVLLELDFISVVETC